MPVYRRIGEASVSYFLRLPPRVRLSGRLLGGQLIPFATLTLQLSNLRLRQRRQHKCDFESHERRQEI